MNLDKPEFKASIIYGDYKGEITEEYIMLIFTAYNYGHVLCKRELDAISLSKGKLPCLIRDG